MTDTAGLNPCRFCGCEGRFHRIERKCGVVGSVWNVNCTKCSAKGPKANSDDEAISLWNAPAPNLDAFKARIRAEALEEAASKATSFLVGDPKNGVPLRSPSPHEIAASIRALKEGDRP